MDASPSTFSAFVGIDVAKEHFDLHVLPQGPRGSLAYDRSGIGRLIAQLKPLGACLVVLEATEIGRAHV